MQELEERLWDTASGLRVSTGKLGSLVFAGPVEGNSGFLGVVLQGFIVVYGV